MALAEAFDTAKKALATGGGIATVILGTGEDAPSEWTWHPRVHWVVASALKRVEVPGAIPTNTKLMFFVGKVDGRVFQPLHDERKRRRLPYMLKSSANAVATELEALFPKHEIPAPSDTVFSPMPSIAATEPANGNGNGAAPAEDKPKQVQRGGLKEFLEKNVDLAANRSIADEARRVFRLAQAAGLPTTLGSVSQGISLMRRKKQLGARPASATPEHVTDTVAVSVAIENAIKALQDIQTRVQRLDTTDDDLRKENEDLKARIGLMRDAFSGL